MNKIAKYIVTVICMMSGLFIGCFGVFGVPAEDATFTLNYFIEKAAMIFVAWLLIETTRATCPEMWADNKPVQDNTDEYINVLDGYDPFVLIEGEDYPSIDEFELYLNVNY